jgi:hypothetical protein
MHGTLAPSGFTPVPEQNTQLTAGSFTSTFPFPMQTWQLDISESNSNGSFPVPLQYAHVIIFFMAYKLKTVELMERATSTLLIST